MQRSCKLVEEVYDVLNLIWKTYHFSPKSTRDLKDLAGELGVNVLKPNQVTGTWWLPHVSRALKVFIKPAESKTPDDTTGQYALVVYHMDHLSASSNNADIKGRAKYIAKRMRDIQFAAFCHFLADMFTILSRLSLKMQSDSLILPAAVSQLNETVAEISCLKNRHVPKGHFQQFEAVLSKSDDKGGMEFQGIQMGGSLEGKVKRSGVGPMVSSEVNKAVDLCVNGLNERFGSLMNTPSPSSSRKQTLYGPPDIVKDLLVLNVDSWPAKDSDLIDFGDTHIERLVNWFDLALKSAGCQVEDVIHQWHSWKIAVNAQFRDKD